MKRIALATIFLIVITATAFAQTATQQQQAVMAAARSVASTAIKPQPKRLASIRTSETTEGSRMVVTSDATLSDYQAYMEGGKFNVLIPTALEPQPQGEMRGRGYTDVGIERRGEDVVLSFALEGGAKARVNQRFNRLEVLFSVPGMQEGAAQVSSTATATPTPTPTPAPSSSPAPSPSPVPATPETKSPSESTTATTVPSSTAASPQTAKVPVPAAATVAGITLPPEKASPVRLPKFDKKPLIDGKLDDAVWQQAVVLKDFYQINPRKSYSATTPGFFT
jgi:hypothetical protein